jgi:DNA-directed RNA polymerase subunit M/transcription elongation factor TFIIS
MYMHKITCPDKFRDNVSHKLFALLRVDIDTDTNHEIKKDNDYMDTLRINMEKGVFNYTIKEATSKKIIKKWDNPYFTQIYIDRLRSIYINLKTISGLRQEIIQQKIEPEKVAFLSHQEFLPERWKTMIDLKIKRDVSKYTNTVCASTDMFTCKKCKSKKCTYYELQTRSADEACTIFVQCIDCGKQWKC